MVCSLDCARGTTACNGMHGLRLYNQGIAPCTSFTEAAGPRLTAASQRSATHQCKSCHPSHARLKPHSRIDRNLKSTKSQTSCQRRGAYSAVRVPPVQALERKTTGHEGQKVQQRNDEVRHAAANALLRDLDCEGGHGALAARQLPGDAGFGLVAERAAGPGEVLLSVPLTLVLQTSDEPEVKSGGVCD